MEIRRITALAERLFVFWIGDGSEEVMGSKLDSSPALSIKTCYILLMMYFLVDFWMSKMVFHLFFVGDVDSTRSKMVDFF